MSDQLADLAACAEHLKRRHQRIVNFVHDQMPAGGMKSLSAEQLEAYLQLLAEQFDVTWGVGQRQQQMAVAEFEQKYFIEAEREYRELRSALQQQLQLVRMGKCPILVAVEEIEEVVGNVISFIKNIF